MIFNLITKAKELFYNNSTSKLSAKNVQAAIDELKSKNDEVNTNLTTHKTSTDHDSRYYTKAQTNALLTSNFGTVSSVVDVNYTKRSGFVFAMCQNAPSSSISANIWNVIANIPSGYRPKYNVPFVGNFGSYVFIGYFYTNGNIVIYPTQELPTGGNGICFNISYPVA